MHNFLTITREYKLIFYFLIVVLKLFIQKIIKYFKNNKNNDKDIFATLFYFNHCLAL